MRNTVTSASGKTTFSMRQETKGQWKGKWIIDDSKTGRPHLILDTEAEADKALDQILSNVNAELEMQKW